MNSYRLYFALIILLIAAKTSAAYANFNHKKCKVAVINTSYEYRNDSKIITENIISYLSEKKIFKMIFAGINEVYIPSKFRTKDDVIKYGVNIDVEVIVVVNLAKTQNNFNLQVRIFDIKKSRLIESRKYNIGNIKTERLDHIEENISNSITKEILSYKERSRHNLLLRPVYTKSLNFRDRTEYGAGVSLLQLAEDYFFTNSVFGIEAQYLFWSGNKKEIYYANFIPGFIRAGYNLHMGNISLLPSVSGGFAYSAFYYYVNKNTSNRKTASSVNPALKLSFDLLYIIERSYLNAAIDYNIIVRENTNLSYVTFSLGFSLSF